MMRNELFPVIIGFSFACRAVNVKNNCSEVIKRFTDKRHIAPELFCNAPVSYNTDFSAFGYILKSDLHEIVPVGKILWF